SNSWAMKKIFFVFFFSSLIYFSFSQIAVRVDSSVVEVYPSNWWVNMRSKQLQLMLHLEGIKKAKNVRINYPGVQVTKINRVESNNYVFVDITISSNAKPGIFPIEVVWKETDDGIWTSTSKFELKPRRPGRGTAFAQGVSSKDFVYLLMPDRFSNGDTTNDRIAGMKDQSLDRSDFFARHGGDLQGVINHLDYLKDLGVTTVWMTPVIENDMPN